MTALGYLGPVGTYSYTALSQYVVDNRVGKNQLIPVSTIIGLFDAFFLNDKNEPFDKKLDYVFVPIENSVNGNIGESLDGLIKYADKDFYILDEVYMKIQTSLLCRENVELDKITDVISHPQPLAQSSQFLRDNCPNAKHTLVESTGAGAQYLSDENKLNDLTFFRNKTDTVRPVFAAIGDAKLADTYGLRVLEYQINDYDNNTTRWFLLGRKKSSMTGNDKSSFGFSIKKDSPGGLYHVLKIFADKSINLTKITSRPIKNIVGEYVFFIDFEGHIEDNMIYNSLEEVKKRSSFFKFFGSYPITGN